MERHNALYNLETKFGIYCTKNHGIRDVQNSHRELGVFTMQWFPKC